MKPILTRKKKSKFLVKKKTSRKYKNNTIQKNQGKTTKIAQITYIKPNLEVY